MDFPKIALRQKDPGKYWSSLYKTVWKVMKEREAVLDREFQYSLEEKGYPPLDVHEVVSTRFGNRGTFRRIDRPVTQLNQKLTFWVMPRQYDANADHHEQIMQKKIELQVQLSQIRHKLGNALVRMIHQAARDTDLTYSRKLTEVRDWNGRSLSQQEGAIDVVLISLRNSKVYGVEAKNVAQIIETLYVGRKLKKHIENCDKLGMEPIFIVSRIFSTAARKLEDLGAKVIETGVQFYQKEYWSLALELRNGLGYHFARRVGHRKLVEQLSRKLCSALALSSGS